MLRNFDIRQNNRAHTNFQVLMVARTTKQAGLNKTKIQQKQQQKNKREKVEIFQQQQRKKTKKKNKVVGKKYYFIILLNKRLLFAYNIEFARLLKVLRTNHVSSSSSGWSGC